MEYREAINKLGFPLNMETYYNVKNEYLESNYLMVTMHGVIIDKLGHIVLSPDQEDRIAEKVANKIISEFRSPTVNTTWERTSQEIERQMNNLRAKVPHMHGNPVDTEKARQALEQEEQQRKCVHEWVAKFSEPSHITCVKCGIRA